MLDYWKLWIYDTPTIERLLSYPLTDHTKTVDEHGVLKKLSGHYDGWKLETLPHPYRLQITGSIHKWWNGGTNENDFEFSDAVGAIQDFCRLFRLPPSRAFIKNLEFGLNIQTTQNVSELMDQIICYNYGQPLRPYSLKTDCYFMEFEQWDYYFKIYDKGKQYRAIRPGIPETLRIEVKARNSRMLRFAKVRTLEDLLKIETLQVLGKKTATLLKGLVFDDDTIKAKELPPKDRKLYHELCNPKKWKGFKGAATATTRKKAARFKRIVEQYGRRRIYSYISQAVNDKLSYYNLIKTVSLFLPKYSRKPDTLKELEPIEKKVCLTCGRDISRQDPKSKYCSAKQVGYEAAHRCRNSSSNPRNNRRRKIARITGRGVLFDIEPYVVERVAARRKSA